MPTLDEKIKAILSEGHYKGGDADDSGVAKGGGHDQSKDQGAGQDSVADAQRNTQKKGQKEGFKPEVDKPGTKTAKASMGTTVPSDR